MSHESWVEKKKKHQQQQHHTVHHWHAESHSPPKWSCGWCSHPPNRFRTLPAGNPARIRAPPHPAQSFTCAESVVWGSLASLQTVRSVIQMASGSPLSPRKPLPVPHTGVKKPGPQNRTWHLVQNTTSLSPQVVNAIVILTSHKQEKRTEAWSDRATIHTCGPCSWHRQRNLRWVLAFLSCCKAPGRQALLAAILATPDCQTIEMISS